ncbi:MAG TPA: ABC transporter permease [bacterium]|jgi:sulfonate transport system permease protein|nr:ABC transporter permease [bacterium]
MTLKPSSKLSWFLPLLIPAILLILWQIASDIGFLKPSILPSPLVIAATLLELFKSGELLKNLEVSLVRVMEGFAIGAGLGLLVGFTMGLSSRMERALSLITGLLRPIPTIAWIPALILWLGIGESSKVVVIAVGSFWPVLLSAIQGVRGTDPKYLEVARVLEKDSYTTILKVVIPSALPSIFTGLRIAMGIAWASVVGAELIAASSGIGFMIMYAREVSQPDVMLVGVLAIGLTGLLIDFLLLQLQKRLLKWSVNP